MPALPLSHHSDHRANSACATHRLVSVDLTVPDSWPTPSNAWSNVVLPLPLGPTTATGSPLASETHPSRARRRSG
jgi:hypothetical protein